MFVIVGYFVYICQKIKDRTMETFIAILAIVLGALAIVGSIAPALPGPPLGWLGMLCLYIWGGGTNGAGEPMSTKFLLIWLAGWLLSW